MKTLRYLLITVLILTAFAACAYASMDDKSDRMSSNQSNTFSPGYINATMQKTQEIIRQAQYAKSSDDNNIENKNEVAGDKLSNKVSENAATRVTPELKKKTGGGEATTKNNNTTTPEAVTTTESKVVDSTSYDVTIGSGKDQIKDASGRLISEIINETRHVYAGFANAGTTTIQEAMNISQTGDRVIVSGGVYYESVKVKDGVSLYGGYNGLGVRDIKNSETKIVFTRPGYDDPSWWSSWNAPIVLVEAKKLTEINGFTFENNDYYGAGVFVAACSGEVRIVNNTFKGYSGDGGIHAENSAFESVSKLVVYNNRFTGQGVSIRSNCSNTIVDNNIITDSSYGLLTTTSGNTTVTNNFFGNNYASLVTYFYDKPATGITLQDVSNNTFYGGYANIEYALKGKDNVFVEVWDSGWDGLYSNLSNNLIDDYNNMGIDPSSERYTSNLITTGYSYGTTMGDYGKISVNYAVAQQALHAFANNEIANLANDMIGAFDDKRYASDLNSANLTGGDNIASVFRDLLKKDTLASSPLGSGGLGFEKQTFSVGSRPFSESTLAIPVWGLDTRRVSDVALALAYIMKSPMEDQKLILDTMQALLAETDNAASQSSEVKKASDDLLQVVANILIAQAIPDLLKEGDMSNIKGIFQDLSTQKDNIMMEYNLIVQPYYKEIKKLLAKNLAVLQLNNVVSKALVEEELNKMEPNEVDKLLEKLRRVSNKSFEEDSILQEEAKLRSKYIDPNKKAFEDKMKAMLEGFTQRLSKVLEATKK